MSKAKNCEELCIDVDILEYISASEIKLLQSHFSEVLKDALMKVEWEKE